jgi:acetyltransferase-like isoleucine patch superfamily enzyme
MSNEVEIIGEVHSHPTAIIKSGCIIGKRFRRLLNHTYLGDEQPTYISENVEIGHNCIIGNGTYIGSNSILDDNTIIETNVKVGIDNLLIYSAQICNDVQIGNNSVIGGFIGERTIIGSNCRVFGKIVHSQFNPKSPWDDDESQESAAIIGNNVFVGFSSIITAPIKVSNNVYICAGSILSKDVPAFHIVYGINKIIHFSKWNGNLKNSNLFIDE